MGRRDGRPGAALPLARARGPDRLLWTVHLRRATALWDGRSGQGLARFGCPCSLRGCHKDTPSTGQLTQQQFGGQGRWVLARTLFLAGGGLPSCCVSGEKAPVTSSCKGVHPVSGTPHDLLWPWSPSWQHLSGGRCLGVCAWGHGSAHSSVDCGGGGGPRVPSRSLSVR